MKPGKDYEWVGTADDPKKIVIPKISVDGFVEQVGVDQNKQVAVPTNIFLVGWFVQTARPGQKGLSVFDGHVTGQRNDGIFKSLDQLKAGDVFSVEMGSGAKKTYKVLGSQSVPVAQSVSVIFSQNPRVSSQLNLVTCSGTFDETTKSYPDRLIVSAALQ